MTEEVEDTPPRPSKRLGELLLSPSTEDIRRIRKNGTVLTKHAKGRWKQRGYCTAATRDRPYVDSVQEELRTVRPVDDNHRQQIWEMCPSAREEPNPVVYTVSENGYVFVLDEETQKVVTMWRYIPDETSTIQNTKIP